MQRRFPAATCHLPKQAPDRQGWMRSACRQLVLRAWCAGALVGVQQPPSPPWSTSWLRQSFLPACLCYSAQAPARPPPVRRAGSELLSLRIDVRERLGDSLLLLGDLVQCRHSLPLETAYRLIRINQSNRRLSLRCTQCNGRMP
jgi:hypothetical protein